MRVSTSESNATSTSVSLHTISFPPLTQYPISVGCTLLENNSWLTVPIDVPIIGLKEHPGSADPLPHVHIQFGHCFKKQAAWSAALARFHGNGGPLYGIGFLTDAGGQRVAAFGFGPLLVLSRWVLIEGERSSALCGRSRAKQS